MYYVLNKSIEIIIDGNPIDDNLIQEFELRNHSRNLRYSSELKVDVVDFVGFIIKDRKILVSFPKHYIDEKSIGLVLKDDFSLLFNTLIKAKNDKNQNSMGEMDNFQSNYPFHAFFEVYKYFLKYGLFQETYNNIKAGYSGKISWKETIRKSQVIFEKNSLIYIPLYIKKNYSEYVFLTECMIYVINYTIERFSLILNLKNITGISIQNEIFENKEFVISSLQKISTKIFKDKDKKLVQSLVEFFKYKNIGGDIVFKHYNFELVWESMVESYLNRYFRGIKDGLPNFDTTEYKNDINFKKARYNVNKINKNHRIEPDHYFVDENTQYIFDSKYYVNLKKIDYKQIAYYSILKSNVSGETFNVLILPSSNEIESKLYFELEESYYEGDGNKIRIITTYLNTKKVLENFNR